MAQVTLREYLQGIEDVISSGHVDDAAKQCQHALSQFPESLEVQRLLGEVYLAQGQMEDAQQALDWILTNDPENVIAYCDRALISERLSDFDTALDCYQQAYELSRGNRDIRQQFNMLSTKAGQQGFMFSRAGLARLYMRGGLLPQAAQEWAAVLSGSPDRLDARTGLLETYWREGQYEETEQLAQQILQDVPACVKALLLLAHVTAPKNMQLAQEYIQRAGLLDPDLLMAQELFEDMMMSQPGNPFLKLLKKPPVVLEFKQASGELLTKQNVSEQPTQAYIPVSEEAILVPDALLHETVTSGSPFEWSSLDMWDGKVETLAGSEVQEQPMAEVATLPTWSHDLFSSNDALALPVQLQDLQESQQHITSTSPEQSMDGIQHELQSQDAQNDAVVASVPQESLAWDDLSLLPEYRTDDESWKNGPDNNQANRDERSWLSANHEETLSSPPAWLTMLTQDEESEQQHSSSEVFLEEHEQKHTPMEISDYQDPVETLPADDLLAPSWRDELHTSLNSSSNDEEPFSFGPEWLKSLGATAIASDIQEQSTQLPVLAVPDSEPEDPLAPFMSAEASSIVPEQTVLNTLEELEHTLLSQGFVPLEPNTLSTIAQSQEPVAGESQVALPYQPKDGTYEYEEQAEQEAYNTAALSSALTQLGDLAMPSYIQPSFPSSESFLPGVQEIANPAAAVEPMWATNLRSVPAPMQQEPHEVVPEAPQAISVPVAPPGRLTFDMASTSSESMSQEQLLVEQNSVEASPEQIVEPTSVQSPVAVHTLAVPPVAQSNSMFESELETTMRRPAIHLQAMVQQQRPGTIARNQSVRVTKGRGSEQSKLVRQTPDKDGIQNSQERLVKGYQHQLVGDYDEAMQEYRIIIKSEPELLDEVVSNIRALLKLTPKYAPGYRVLGDAYMRQGEYLQAMEAYNKALTMTKKAKA